MNLTKLLRKNSRTLLMVFMSLLLVAFLVPNSIQGCNKQGNEGSFVLGEVYGHRVTAADRNSAGMQLRILRAMNIPMPTDDNFALTYYLLTAEAEHLGVRFSEDHVKSMLTQANTTNDEMARIQAVTRASYSDIYRAVGEWLAMMQVQDLYASALVPTVPRLAAQYRNQTQQADTRCAIIDARAFLPLVPEPTDEQLAEFFDETKDRFPAHTEDTLVYGYELPDRVQIEYLTVDPERVLRRVSAPDSKVREFFNDHQQRYVKPDPNEPMNAGGRPAMVPMTFAEAQAEVREDYRLSRAIELAQGIMNDIYADAHEPWRNAEKNEQGYAIAPSNVVSFEDLAARYNERQPVTYEKTDLLSQEQVRRLIGLGQAGRVVGNQRLTVAELVFQGLGLEPTPDPNATPPRLSQLEPAELIFAYSQEHRVSQYQTYLFRVVAVAPKEPPANWQDMRERLTADWKFMRAFDLAGEAARQLAEQARTVGLDEAAKTAEQLRATLAAASNTDPNTPLAGPDYTKIFEPFTPRNVTRMSQFVQPNIGLTTLLPRAIFALADDPNAGTHPTAVVPLVSMQTPDQSRWVVAELIGVDPVYDGPFEARLAQQANRPPQDDYRLFSQNWASLDNVIKRTGFQPSERLQKSQDQESQGD